MTLKQAAQTALDVQNACNLSGVLRTWGETRDAVNAACAGTRERNGHPVNVLFANKCADMTGQFCDDAEPYSRAYEACQAIARGDA
jgi:hypothetical protein